MANAITHFEIHAGDPQRAIKFYETVFEWKFKKLEISGGMDYWLVSTGRGKGQDGSTVGIDGGLLKRQGGAPGEKDAVNGYVCTIGVDNIDEHCKKAKDAGGTEAAAKMKIMEMGWVAYYKDTEGNIFGMFEPSMSMR